MVGNSFEAKSFTLIGHCQGLLQSRLRLLWGAVKAEHILTALNPPQRCVHALNLLIIFIDVEDFVEQMIKA